MLLMASNKSYIQCMCMKYLLYIQPITTNIVYFTFIRRHCIQRKSIEYFKMTSYCLYLLALIFANYLKRISWMPLHWPWQNNLTSQIYFALISSIKCKNVWHVLSVTWNAVLNVRHLLLMTLKKVYLTRVSKMSRISIRDAG